LARRSDTSVTVVLVILVFAALIYGGIAITTVDNCGRGAPKRWSWFPPQWECVRGF
jgi:hypothetical protein